ncbi:MAG: response regulator transcription factor [Spirochaetaceae bacterium]|jgi:DNA-binding response OmpR family regulator|nr:response regulator transcription factor [Spirochaetaceae bacterium]
MDNITILVAEDEESMNSMICDYLQAMGYQTISAFDGIEALEIFRQNGAQLLLLDAMMPRMEGFDVIRRIRQESQVPIILLTARAEEGDKLLGLEIGADDYITKPFSLKELEARIRVILRRMKPSIEPQEESIIIQGDLKMDIQARQLWLGEREIPLTAVQFDILHKFMTNPGRVYRRMELLESFQQDPWEGYERTMDVHIKNIRKLIEEDPSNPRFIQTVWGVGYRFSGEYK